ncbi:patatin-like phospholipase family protein [Thermodesulfobacteriota bacterium]
MKTKLGLALSGGGFRSTAFHLGVLKRLHELGILDKVDVFSTVSGGSIVGAFYVYRILYSIQDDELTVWVVKVGHRKDIYR